MTKVVYIYVYPSYTLTSLLDKIYNFYIREFDTQDTHVYFVGVFTQNEKILYDYGNQEQISETNLENIKKQIFPTSSGIFGNNRRYVSRWCRR